MSGLLFRSLMELPMKLSPVKTATGDLVVVTSLPDGGCVALRGDSPGLILESRECGL